MLAGETVCFFGAKTNKKKCGPIIGVYGFVGEKSHPLPGPIYNIKVGGNFHTEGGDSGGPVWNEESGDVVGMISATFFLDRRASFAPLFPVPNYEDSAPGVLKAPGMERKPGVPPGLKLETVR